MARQFCATAENFQDYWRLLVNRRAYVVQSPPASPGERLPLLLPPESLKRRRTGGDRPPAPRRRITTELHATNPETQRSKLIAIDGDYADALKHLRLLQWAPTANVEAALEMSRRGAHLGILARSPAARA